MRLGQKRNKPITVSDPRDFGYTIFFEGFNNLVATANTSVDEHLLDVHLEALTSYKDYLLLMSGGKVIEFTREVFSIGWLRWHVTRIHRQIQRSLENLI